MHLPGHGVERLYEIRSTLQNDLLLQLLGISGMSWNELLQALEAVVDCGFIECCLIGVEGRRKG